MGLKAVVAAVLATSTFACSPSSDVQPRDRHASSPSAAGQDDGRARTAGAWKPATDGKAPNILLVVTDDQRASGTLEVMPETTEFFSQGSTFRQAFATTPLCCPARASIMNGRYVHNHGIERNWGVTPERLGATLQGYLQESGYQTAMAGKLFNDWRSNVAPPGFDRWAVSLELNGGDYFDSLFNIDGRQVSVSRYSTDFISDRSIASLRTFEGRDSTPWFLYVAPYAPHNPATPAPRYRSTEVPPLELTPAIEESDRSDKPKNIRKQSATLSEASILHDDQLRTLLSVDDLVASLTRELTRLNEDRNTLVVYTSDNGQMLGEHGVIDKRYPYRESIQIPLMMRWPGHVAVGIDERFALNVDLAPTLLDAAGIEASSMDGRSLFDEWDRDWVLTEHWKPTWASITTDTYQYVEWYAPDRTTVTFREFYDLARDPWQLDNVLADDDPSNDPPADVLRTAEARLAEDRFCSGRACP